jgi:excisionase family DNA binding protein
VEGEEDMPKLVDVKTASELLGVSTKKVWAMVYARDLPAVRVGRCVRLSIRSLEEFIEASTTPARVA